MKKCDWCGRLVTNPKQVESLGEMYRVCDTCFDANANDTCIKCGKALGWESGRKGLCADCFEEQYEESQRKNEEMLAGIDIETYSIYTSEIEFTEEDYERWVTCGQGNFTPDNMKKYRLIWLKSKLSGSPTWTSELVEEKFDDIEKLLNGNLSKLTSGGFILINRDSKAKGPRITEFINKSGTVYLIKKK